MSARRGGRPLRVIVLACLLAALPSIAWAQEETVEEPKSRLSLASWCALEQPEEGEDGFGCDAGVGMALIGREFRQGTLSAVGALGSRSIGFGIAWTVKETRFSVALGMAAPFGETGISLGDAVPVLGGTVRLR